MDFGVVTLTRGAASTREGYLAVAHAAERAGFGFLGVNDHVVVPRAIASRYPYSASGAWAASKEGACLDQLATLAFLAGATQRLRLLTSVLVVPQRQPVLAAKMLTTIDVLSGGRLIVGCGAGWLKEEFEAVGAAPFAERGRVTDAYIAAFKSLWTADAPAMEETYARFRDILFEPKPVQRPHPPIWIGGESPSALARVVRLGDGWYPASNNPRHPLDTPARLKAAVGELARIAERAGRDPASIDLAIVVLAPVEFGAPVTAAGERRLFSGSAADMAGDVKALADAGIRHLALSFQTASLPETLARMERFAREVMPLTS
jgi:probable F420-dependent oxidoreductase